MKQNKIFWAGAFLLTLIIAVTVVVPALTQPTRITVSETGGFLLGDNNAPVTIIEFSDFQCPYCGKFYQQTLPGLKEKYIDTGKVRFIYREFPLTTIHENSLLAAQAAEAAGEQGKFWEMHNLLYENQNALDLQSLQKYAALLNLDRNRFNSDIASGKFLGKIQSDIVDGKAYGVKGTPTFFIDGIKLEGAQPLPELEKVIDAELARKK